MLWRAAAPTGRKTILCGLLHFDGLVSELRGRQSGSFIKIMSTDPPTPQAGHIFEHKLSRLQALEDVRLKSRGLSRKWFLNFSETISVCFKHTKYQQYLYVLNIPNTMQGSQGKALQQCLLDGIPLTRMNHICRSDATFLTCGDLSDWTHPKVEMYMSSVELYMLVNKLCILI